MKANIIKFIPKEIEINIDGITLLSIEEYNKYKENIPPLYEWWWLRSPGNYSTHVADAYNDNSVRCNGYRVSNDNHGIRPALKISNHNLNIKDKFIFKDYNWTVISEDLAICNTSIGKYCFRKDWEATDANEYETSDIKKYIEDWLNKEEKNNGR